MRAFFLQSNAVLREIYPLYVFVTNALATPFNIENFLSFRKPGKVNKSTI